MSTRRGTPPPTTSAHARRRRPRCRRRPPRHRRGSFSAAAGRAVAAGVAAHRVHDSLAAGSIALVLTLVPLTVEGECRAWYDAGSFSGNYIVGNTGYPHWLLAANLNGFVYFNTGTGSSTHSNWRRVCSSRCAEPSPPPSPPTSPPPPPKPPPPSAPPSCYGRSPTPRKRAARARERPAGRARRATCHAWGDAMIGTYQGGYAQSLDVAVQVHSGHEHLAPHRRVGLVVRWNQINTAAQIGRPRSSASTPRATSAPAAAFRARLGRAASTNAPSRLRQRAQGGFMRARPEPPSAPPRRRPRRRRPRRHRSPSPSTPPFPFCACECPRSFEVLTGCCRREPPPGAVRRRQPQHARYDRFAPSCPDGVARSRAPAAPAGVARAGGARCGSPPAEAFGGYVVSRQPSACVCALPHLRSAPKWKPFGRADASPNPFTITKHEARVTSQYLQAPPPSPPLPARHHCCFATPYAAPVAAAVTAAALAAATPTPPPGPARLPPPSTPPPAQRLIAFTVFPHAATDGPAAARRRRPAYRTTCSARQPLARRADALLLVRLVRANTSTASSAPAGLGSHLNGSLTPRDHLPLDAVRFHLCLRYQDGSSSTTST